MSVSKFAPSAALSMTTVVGLAALLAATQASAFKGYGEEECVGEVRSVAVSAGSLLQPGTVGEIKCKMHDSCTKNNGYGDTLECETRDGALIDLATQGLVNEQEMKLIATRNLRGGYDCKKVKIFPNSPDNDSIPDC
jgi:hypothetical protein